MTALIINHDADLAAILDGSRRVFAEPILPRPVQASEAEPATKALPGDWLFRLGGGHTLAVARPRASKELLLHCRYRPTQMLWVREAWAPDRVGFRYRASRPADPEANWRPAVLMPRAACRIILLVQETAVGRRSDPVPGLPAWRPAEGATDAWVWLVRFEAQGPAGKPFVHGRE